MRLARKLGTITYRSAAEWKHRFGRRPASDRRYEALPPGRAHFPAEFAVQDYLNAQADKFVSVFDPNCYLYLSRAMDRFDLSAHGGTPSAALKRAAAERALVIGVESDILFTINEQNAIADAFEAAGHRHRVRAAGLARRARRLPRGHRAVRRGHRPFPRLPGPTNGADSDL